MKAFVITAALITAPLFSVAPAVAQPDDDADNAFAGFGHDPDLVAREELPDARTVDVLRTPEGYRIDLFDGARQPEFAATAEAAALADIDGDGAEDLIVFVAEPVADGLLGAHVWDLTLGGPSLMHVSSGITARAAAAEELAREVRGRFTLANGRAAIGYMRDSLDLPAEADWETRNLAFPNHLNTLEGVLAHAEVRAARAALALTEDAEAGNEAFEDLQAALARREAFAREHSGEIYD